MSHHVSHVQGIRLQQALTPPTAPPNPRSRRSQWSRATIFLSNFLFRVMHLRRNLQYMCVDKDPSLETS